MLQENIQNLLHSLKEDCDLILSYEERQIVFNTYAHNSSDFRFEDGEINLLLTIAKFTQHALSNKQSLFHITGKYVDALMDVNIIKTELGLMFGPNIKVLGDNLPESDNLRLNEIDSCSCKTKSEYQANTDQCREISDSLSQTINNKLMANNTSETVITAIKSKCNMSKNLRMKRESVENKFIELNNSQLCFLHKVFKVKLTK